ncbi:predicted protein [Naegleria gruberi]|uniref:Predicted protein n=1 Tax=Naegleria gruberi TaxID=5762 RepID=D2V700_NAEGR|nr:uncharacterized protein NAEGRDRAFT_64616 [Naegleria gruberi]EFC47286.1 predicted protein [Naegleria gruberi]|eukprot:XP_002680030.1 predicted protein [Naegleria gruberi strain NEG-M]
MSVFVKFFFEKVIYSDGSDKSFKKQNDKVYSPVFGEFMKENHHGMITHKTPNRPYSFALSENENRTIAQQQQMEYYGHYVNPITGLPSFPDYITQEDRQLEELRRMDGTNRWMNQ